MDTPTYSAPAIAKWTLSAARIIAYAAAAAAAAASNMTLRRGYYQHSGLVLTVQAETPAMKALHEFLPVMCQWR